MGGGRRAAPRSQAAAPALRGQGRSRTAGNERKVREAEALQHVSCNCAPARCRVADEGSYYQPCDRKG